MAFKMKGFPLHSGTSIAKQYKSDAQRKAIYASKAERSAAKQKSADLKTLDELIEEGFTPADARRMQKDKAVTGVEKETDKQKMQRLEDEAAKANKAGDTEKAKKLMAQVSKLEDKIQGTTKPPTKQKKEMPKPPPAPVPTFTPPGYGKLSPYNKETKKDRKKKKKDGDKEISPTKQKQQVGYLVDGNKLYDDLKQSINQMNSEMAKTKMEFERINMEEALRKQREKQSMEDAIQKQKMHDARRFSDRKQPSIIKPQPLRPPVN